MRVSGVQVRSIERKDTDTGSRIASTDTRVPTFGTPLTVDPEGPEVRQASVSLIS